MHTIRLYLHSLEYSTSTYTSYKRVVKGGRGIDHVSRKIKQPFHNLRKIQHWHFTLHAKKKRTYWKITVHGDYGNHDSRGKKMATSHFTGNKKGRSRVTKIPFTTLLQQQYSYFANTDMATTFFYYLC